MPQSIEIVPVLDSMISPDSGYSKEFYDHSHYGVKRLGITGSVPLAFVTRIVRPYVEPKPVIDTLAFELSRRFNWLQQALQVFGLIGKIEYASGQDLEDNWGKVYNLPRLTGESDEYYRARIQTYHRVVTGSGTILNAQEVIDHLIGVPGGSKISSVWPAKVQIEFDKLEAAKIAQEKRPLLESILPGMFAAGVTYDLRFCFASYSINAKIVGTRSINHLASAAVCSNQKNTYQAVARILANPVLHSRIGACIQGVVERDYRIETAIMCDRPIGHIQMAAILKDLCSGLRLATAVQTTRGHEYNQYCTILGRPAKEYSQHAAIARSFGRTCVHSARIVHASHSGYKVSTAIRTECAVECGIRARIARRY